MADVMTTPLHLELDGIWSLTFGPEIESSGKLNALDALRWPTISMRVPGRVEEALVEAGRALDPEVGSRAWEFSAYEGYEWWLRRTFVVPVLPVGTRWQLVFDGVDCLATYWVDGREIGHSDNMFIPHRFDVDLTPGVHTLAIRLGSAVRAGRRDTPAIGANMQSCTWESWRIRKAAHQYGWDIFPRLVSAGLWRSVRLEAVPLVRVRDFFFGTLSVDPEAGRAKVAVAWTFDLPEREWAECNVRIQLECQGRVVSECRAPVLGHHGRKVLELSNVNLWWPLGWGEPTLHQVTVELVNANGQVLASASRDVGVRTVELRRTNATTPAGDGEFVFIVNGRRLYARGTNWVGLDALNRRDEERLAESVAMLVDLNCNMVRCWGGAPYEDDAFYDACDREGILVWQDFALACVIPAQDDDFARAMRVEAESVVRRLRHHACMALWCGGNETDDAYSWSAIPGGDPNKERITRDVLAAVVREEDPLRSYLPSSPYLSPEVMRGAARPEDHLWGTRDDFQGAFYRGSAAHFVSEIGYHGCPEAASLKEMIEPGAPLWPIVDNPAYHAKAVRALPRHEDCDYRLPLMARQSRLLTGEEATDLNSFVLASQITQAEALKSFIESWRVRKGRTTGLLWWNLRDGWPLISDAIVDWYGRRKAAYAVVRRAQALTAVMVGEVESGQRRVMVVHDGNKACNGTVVVHDLDDDTLLFKANVTVGAETATLAGRLPEPLRPGCWRLEWTPDGGASEINHILVGPRPYGLENLVRWYRQLKLPLPEPLRIVESEKRNLLSASI